MNSTDYPFYLQNNSPCIDTAKPDTIGLFLPEFDILGNLRIFDGDGNGEIIVDMGAFEFIEGFIGVNGNVIDNPLITLYNFPNPFKPSGAGRSPATTIFFSLNTENTEDTELIIYNIKGQKIKQFSIFNPSNAGQVSQYSIVWEGTDDTLQPVSSGIYFYQLIINNKTTVIKKMSLLR